VRGRGSGWLGPGGLCDPRFFVGDSRRLGAVESEGVAVGHGTEGAWTAYRRYRRAPLVLVKAGVGARGSHGGGSLALRAAVCVCQNVNSAVVHGITKPTWRGER